MKKYVKKTKKTDKEATAIILKKDYYFKSNV